VRNSVSIAEPRPFLYCAALFVLTAGLAFGHHSFSAQYDASKPITLHGIVTRLEWTNPHAGLYLDVIDGSGKVTAWEFELGSPNGLRSAGWTRNSLRPGQEVTVRAFPAKDGSHLGNAFSIQLADGTSLLSGVSTR
jgi:hypothetical protein